jgi:hypothetical protein
VVDRAYYIVRTPATHARPEVDDFVKWLIDESADVLAPSGPADSVAAARKSQKKVKPGRSKR